MEANEAFENGETEAMDQSGEGSLDNSGVQESPESSGSKRKLSDVTFEDGDCANEPGNTEDETMNEAEEFPPNEDDATATDEQQEYQEERQVEISSTSASGAGFQLDKSHIIPEEKNLVLRAGELDVYCLGTVVCDRPKFHTSNHIFPVGFCSERIFPSYIHAGEQALYTCKIIDGGDEVQPPSFLQTVFKTKKNFPFS